MAEAFLTRELARRGTPATAVTVRSAGVMRRPSEGAPPHTCTALHERGIDVTAHRSRTLEPSHVVAADLVIGMERAHLRAAAVMAPDALAKTFTLKELVRRGLQHGPRAADEPLQDWLARIAADRDPAELLHDDDRDRVDDPQGQPLERFRVAAQEIELLTGGLALLLWGPAPAG
jgi:protein-tyrosine phosphatase